MFAVCANHALTAELREVEALLHSLKDKTVEARRTLADMRAQATPKPAAAQHSGEGSSSSQPFNA